MEVYSYYYNQILKTLYVISISVEGKYKLHYTVFPFNKFMTISISNSFISKALNKNSEEVLEVENYKYKIHMDRFIKKWDLEIQKNDFNSLKDISYWSYKKVTENQTIYFGSSFCEKDNVFLHNDTTDLIYLIDFNENRFIKYTPHFELSHKLVGDNKVPCIVSKIRSNKFVFMLHGGPDFSFDYSYDEISEKLVDHNINLIKINYPGSTRYSNHYQKILLGKGGTIDVEAVKSVVQFYQSNFDDIFYVVYGDSYGGFLALFSSLNADARMKGVVATGAFTDINYGLLFSNSRKVLIDYVDSVAADNLHIQLIRQKNTIPITLIHGSKDMNSPIIPIRLLSNKNKSIKLIELDDYSHFEISKIKQHRKNKLIVHKILEYFATN